MWILKVPKLGLHNFHAYRNDSFPWILIFCAAPSLSVWESANEQLKNWQIQVKLPSLIIYKNPTSTTKLHWKMSAYNGQWKSYFYAGRDASWACVGSFEMSSIGAGFAAPCFQLLRFLTKPPVAAPLLIVATVVILINGYRLGQF